MTHKGKISCIGLYVLLTAFGAFAQVTGNGTPGAVPVFMGTTSIGNSSAPIVVSSSGDVGIGTTNPSYLLEVAGSAKFGSYQTSSTTYFPTAQVNVIGATPNIWIGASGWSSNLGQIGFGYIPNSTYPSSVIGETVTDDSGQTDGDLFFATRSTTADTPPSERMRIRADGNIGIGTSTPNSRLTLQGPYGSNQFLVSYDGTNGIFFQADGAGTHFNWRISQQNFTSGALQFTPSTAPGGSTFITPSITILNSGYVGIGVPTPGKPLDVSGTIRTAASGNDIGCVIYPDGSQQVTAWTGTVCGGDYAESVDVSGDRTHYEPGDVLVIDPDASGKFLKSSEPYSTSVTGIYSTKPGTVGRRQNTPKSTDEVPMAMIGIVPTKVSAENGPIRPGDLLVTASTPGYSMKGTDRSRMLGAVIGKAAGKLDNGKGVIEVVVTLQ